MYKKSSPRNWLMTPKTHSRHGGLPPSGRRNSNNLLPPCQVAPANLQSSRSRSLDGLLDSDTDTKHDKVTINIEDSNTESDPENDIDVNCEVDKTNNNPSDTSANTTLGSNQRSASLESVDKCSIVSSTGSESKRKRKFMDRCVNKMKLLIKK